MWCCGHTPQGTEQNLYECTVLSYRTISAHGCTKSGHLQRIFWVLNEHAVEQLTSSSDTFFSRDNIPIGSKVPASGVPLTLDFSFDSPAFELSFSRSFLSRIPHPFAKA